jgi:hypothetical protein
MRARLSSVSSRSPARQRAETAAARPGAARWIAPVALTLLGAGLLVYFLAPYRHDIRSALDRASVASLVELTALSLVALALRTEVWGVALAAAERRPPRPHLHAANGGSFLVSLANHYVAPWIKMWLLRRMEGPRARALLQLVTIDIAATILEVLLAAALVVFATLRLSLAWWVPLLLIGGALGLLVVAIALHRRFPDHPAVQGLNVLMRGRYRWRVLALLALVFAFQIVRTWLSLRTVGLHPPFSDAVLVFVTTGVLGALPTGITAAPTTASLIVVGSRGIGSAAGAGVLVTGSLFAATLLYAAAAGAAYWVSRAPLR